MATVATGEIRENKIGYIKIASFSEGAAKTKEILKSFDKKGIRKIVIDLCDNPGGAQKELLDIFNLFAPKGPVLNVIFEKEKISYTSTNKSFGKYDTAVLVNKNSASAAEAFAGTMQDTSAAVIIGEPTYGKGTVTRIAQEGKREGIVRRVGTYTTAANRRLNGVGVIPDICITPGDDMYEKASEILCNKRKPGRI